MSLKDYHIFSFEFETKDGVNGRLAKDCNDDIIIDIAGFSSLTFCSADQFEYITDIDVDNINIDDIVQLDDVLVTITSIDTETKAEFNSACEAIEMREWAYWG